MKRQKLLAVPRGTAVELHGFKKNVQHNGRHAMVGGYDATTGRYQLVMDDSVIFAALLKGNRLYYIGISSSDAVR